MYNAFKKSPQPTNALIEVPPPTLSSDQVIPIDPSK